MPVINSDRLIGLECAITGLESLVKISWGHIEGVRAAKGPPGLGMKSAPHFV